MASVKKHLPILKLLQKSKPKLRKSILTHADLDLIKTLHECIYNTLKGNIPINKSLKRKLKCFKTVLRRILRTSGLKKKRKAIVQSGGAFLPFLLAPIVEAALTHFIA